MKLMRKNILSIFVIFVISILIVFSSVCPIYVKADNSSLEFDKTNVLDDLQNMTLDGKNFSLEDYNFDSKKNTQILSFVEYCYSFYEEKQGTFGLYVYIYNPKGLKFDVYSSLNKIQFATTKDTDSVYKKYSLSYLNKSEKVDYSGLFYKFKVNLTEEEKNAILNSVNSSSRVYKVSGFELVKQGNLNATDYPVSLEYKYSGYAKGCGPDEKAESTLTFTSELCETLSLDVNPSVYRPKGTNGKNIYTQDSLHSVYFSVPKKIINKYGEMSAIHATWLNAVLKPGVVVGNSLVYDELYKNLGKSSIDYYDNITYMLLGAYKMIPGNSKNGVSTKHLYGYAYNCFPSYDSNGSGTCPEFYGSVLDKLYLLFSSGSGLNSADTYSVSSKKILEQLALSKDLYNGDLVNDKYLLDVFESVDEKFTEVNIKADDTYSLDSELLVLGSSFWDRLFGITYPVCSTFDGIQAIYPVKESDLIGSVDEISERLFLSKSDVLDFVDYYNSYKWDSNVYLFRYQVSDYISQEATSFVKAYVFGSYCGYSVVDTNAYFFQETVNLDFDIIDVTFSTGEIETVIPVVSSPIDVVGPATPPVYTTRDSFFDLITVILLIISLIFIIWVLDKFGLLKYIGKGLIIIITAPFKFFKWLIGKIKGD